MYLYLWLLIAGCAEEKPEVPPASRPWHAPAAGTVRDPSTRLIWSRCAPGQAMLDVDCQGEALRLYMEEAEEICAGLALAGLAWRLPTLTESGTLIVCPDGATPSPETGCAEPHFDASHNPAWFPNEGPEAMYWTSDRAPGEQAGGAELQRTISMNSGAAGAASLIRDRRRARCVSDGAAFVKPAGQPEDGPDPELTLLRVVRGPGLPVWGEASIQAAPVGSLAPGQLVVTGPPGAEVRWQDRPARLVKVQGHLWAGWTLDVLLDPLPPAGVLEAIQAAWAGPLLSGGQPEEGRERLVPGEQYLYAGPGAGPGRVRVALQAAPQSLSGEVDATALRWVEPGEFVCRRRQDALREIPASLFSWWPRDPQGCEHYQVIKEPPIFPDAQENWRMYGPEGGFNGWMVDGVPVWMDGRPLQRVAGDVWRIDAADGLKLYRLRRQGADLLLDRREAAIWTAEADGRLTASDGNICRPEGAQYVCVH